MALPQPAGHRRARTCLMAIAAGLLLSAITPVTAAERTVQIAVPVSLTGFSAAAGKGVAEAAQMAADEANLDGSLPRIELDIVDDQSRPDKAKELASAIIAGRVVAVVGPGTSPAAQAGGPIYAEGGLASIIPYAHGAAVANATTFLTTFSSAEMGSLLANYLRYGLGAQHVVLIYKDNGYGKPVAAGFKASAERLGIDTVYHPFDQVGDAAAAATQAAADPAKPTIVLGMVDGDAAPVLMALARQGLHPTVFGTSAIADRAMLDFFAKEPEARIDPGFFTEGVYAVAPLMVDSANAETLRFVERYSARYGHSPRWEAAQGYDAARLAVAAARAAVAEQPDGDVHALRAAVLAFLNSLKDPLHAAPSLTGPLWFTSTRNRVQPGRVGRFHAGEFESAPIQLVPVASPTAAEIASGAVVETGPGLYARRQQVVYAGVFLNEVPRIDIALSTFTADFYLWLRYTPDAGKGTVDPADIDFPDLVRGTFDPKKPAEQDELDDGTIYRLWRMRGDFKNDFDLHHYPLDRQALSLSFFHARAASDRLVYVQDRRSTGPRGRQPLDGSASKTEGLATLPDPSSETGPADRLTGPVSPGAFRNLTQWSPLGLIETRDIRVTSSALGNPRSIGLARVREVAGFNLTIDVRRRVLATLAKTLLPLGLMTLIMYASLNFPHGLVKEKITVAITGALSGAVLLSSINTQLGAVGYVLAIEYVFYVFFGLCLVAIVSVLAAERLRVANRKGTAAVVERSTLVVFIATVIAILIVARQAYVNW